MEAGFLLTKVQKFEHSAKKLEKEKEEKDSDPKPNPMTTAKQHSKTKKEQTSVSGATLNWAILTRTKMCQDEHQHWMKAQCLHFESCVETLVNKLQLCQLKLAIQGRVIEGLQNERKREGGTERG